MTLFDAFRPAWPLLPQWLRRWLALFAAPAVAAGSRSARAIGRSGKRSDPAAFDVAKQIGLDGVQIDMGTAANDMHLRQPEVQQKLSRSRQTHRAGNRLAGHGAN